MIVMGSGAVGVEFASVYHRFGCETTVVELDGPHRTDRRRGCFKGTRPCVQETGHQDETGIKLDKLEKSKKGVKVSGKNAKGEAVSFEAEMLLVAVGRMPYLEGLGLENTKVKVNERGTVKVNEFCETDEPGIYAIGDVIDTAWLAHLASKEGILVVEKIAGKRLSRSNRPLFPTVPIAIPRSPVSA
jgi:dihydrolipoamide dehydrogenase